MELKVLHFFQLTLTLQKKELVIVLAFKSVNTCLVVYNWK